MALMTPHKEVRAGDFDIGPVIRRRAAELQRQGLTLTEIARRLGYMRPAIVQILYTDKVQQK